MLALEKGVLALGKGVLASEAEEETRAVMHRASLRHLGREPLRLQGRPASRHPRRRLRLNTSLGLLLGPPGLPRRHLEEVAEVGVRRVATEGGR